MHIFPLQKKLVNMFARNVVSLGKFAAADGLEHYATSMQMHRVNNITQWRETALDPFLNDYDDPVVIAISRKLRQSDTVKIEAPAWAREIFDDANHRWYLTSREDVIVFKLIGNTRIATTMEVNKFVELLETYSASKNLFTGIEYYINCIGDKHE